MAGETKLPGVPDPSRDPDGFMKALKEIVEVREGTRGNPLDRALTARDLIDAGLAAPQPRIAGRGRLPASAMLIPVSQGGAGGEVGSGIKPILTEPTRPRDLVAVGTFSSILLSWGSPNYANHAYTEILRADVDDIGQAVVIGSSVGTQYADAVGEAANKYYWVRFVSTSNVKGPSSTFVNGRTALNPRFVMANLLATVWEPQKAYSSFMYVKPTVDNGFMYRAVKDGVSGATEPNWPAQVDAQVNDGDTRWVCVPADERAPFIIGTVNGQPAVIIDNAFIGDATISAAKIKDAFLDNLTAIHGTLAFARIERGQIFELAIDGEIRSSTYSPLNNEGFILRNEPGRDQFSPGSRQYTAEFYGDTLFSGDVRAARLLGGMLVASTFGVPTEADNGSFEFIAAKEVLTDSVNLQRSDPIGITIPRRVIVKNSNGTILFDRVIEFGAFFVHVYADTFTPRYTFTFKYPSTQITFPNQVTNVFDNPIVIDFSTNNIAQLANSVVFKDMRQQAYWFVQDQVDGRFYATLNLMRFVGVRFSDTTQQTQIISNNLTIAPCDAIGEFFYRRYKNYNVPCAITFQRRSIVEFDFFCRRQYVLNVGGGTLNTNKNALNSNVDFTGYNIKTLAQPQPNNPPIHYYHYDNTYYSFFICYRNSVEAGVTEKEGIYLKRGIGGNSNKFFIEYIKSYGNYQSSIIELQQIQFDDYTLLYYSDSNIEVSLRLSDGYIGGNYCCYIDTSSFILFKRIYFSSPNKDGLVLKVSHVRNPFLGLFGLESNRMPTGLDMGVVFSTVADNTV